MNRTLAGRRSPGQWLAVYLRGFAMGVAELVPGVSGGTIAFVTGIYEELIRMLAGFRPDSVRILVRDGIPAFWREHNLSFAVALGAGMISAVLVLAGFLKGALETHRPVVWAFFFGVVVVSIWQLARSLPVRRLAVFAPAGLALGLALVSLPGLGSSEAPWVFFIGGLIAVSAWMLPAISGSFLLLVLGLYEPLLEALTAPDLLVVAVFAAGCVSGILLTANALAWLLRMWRDPLLALLTGFMTGALLQLWPWQHDGAHLLPEAYRAASGSPMLLGPVALAALAGAAGIVALSRLRP